MTKTVKVNLLSVTAANAAKKRTATYGVGNGNPSWVTVTTTGDNAGDIDVSHPSNNQKNKTIDLQWSLPSGFGTTFDGTNPFASTYTDFTVVSGAGTRTLTVSDTNDDPDVGNKYSYSLNLSDGTSIDPKVINY